MKIYLFILKVKIKIHSSAYKLTLVILNINNQLKTLFLHLKENLSIENYPPCELIPICFSNFIILCVISLTCTIKSFYFIICFLFIICYRVVTKYYHIINLYI